MLPEITEVHDPEKAQAAIDRLAQLADEWALKLHNAEQELKRIEATAGETVLAGILQGGDGSSKAVTTLANARAQHDVAVKTLEAVEHHQVVAKANLKLAQAHQKRQEATQKATERDAHLQQVNTLLGQLQALDGARYVPFKPAPLMPGEYRDPQPYAVPVSEQMEREIRRLVSVAERLESEARAMMTKADGQRKGVAAHGLHR